MAPGFNLIRIFGNCAHLWKPTWGRELILPGDAGRSWVLLNPAHFAIFRLFMAVCGALFLIYSAATDRPGPGPSDPAVFAAAWFAYWKFYTHWTLALGTLYFACASLYSYWLRKQEMHPQATQQEHELSLEVEAQTQPLEAVGELTEDDESEVELQDDGVAPAERNNGADEADRRRAEAANALNHRLRNRLDQQDSYHRSHMRIKVSFGELCLWLGYETIWAASIFLSITFWVFVGLGCLPHKGCQNVPGNFWAGQILNILFIGSELALNKLPFIPTHSVWTLCYCFLWLIFSTMLFLLTGQWFYPTEDPHRGQLRAAFTFWPGWIVLNVVSFMLGLLIEWVVARIFPSKHTFMTPNRGSS